MWAKNRVRNTVRTTMRKTTWASTKTRAKTCAKKVCEKIAAKTPIKHIQNHPAFFTKFFHQVFHRLFHRLFHAPQGVVNTGAAHTLGVCVSEFRIDPHSTPAGNHVPGTLTCLQSAGSKGAQRQQKRIRSLMQGRKQGPGSIGNILGSYERCLREGIFEGRLFV